MNRIAPNVSTAAAWGDRPPARRIRIRNGRHTILAARGFFDIELPSGMILIGLRLMTGKRGPWVAIPPQHQLDRTGNPRRDVHGKPIFTQLVEFRNRATADRFAAEVIVALQRDHQDAIEGDAP